MKTILVPIDFSTNSKTALNYAAMIAQKTNASIILMNAHNVAMPDPFFPWSAISSMEVADWASKEMQKLCNETTDYKHVKCTYIMEYGEPVEVIKTLTETKNIDLVVMGTRGAGAEKKKFIGSNTKGVIRKAACPVIAVPDDASFDQIKEVTYATDYRNSDLSALKNLSDLLGAFNMMLHIIHISTGEYTDATEQVFMNKFVKDAAAAMDYGHISFEIVHSDRIEHVLNDLVENRKTDILVMSTQKRNFLENLWEKSMTEELLPHLRIPLMAFHHKKESVYFLS